MHDGDTRQAFDATNGSRTCHDDRTVLSIRHFTETDIARRWRMSVRTLQAWRWKKIGPPYLKAMGKVLYRLSDIETFETDHLRGGR